MKRATVTEAKNHLSSLLDRVKAGETILITDRRVPVARLEPAIGGEGDDEARLARLERKGIIRRGKGGISNEILEPPPKLPPGVSVVDALIQERREGR
ncbi:MAG: type II toxin-antitoxin system Phd/YefM family antitoxin [Actinomycetota bacterium]